MYTVITKHPLYDVNAIKHILPFIKQEELVYTGERIVKLEPYVCYTLGLRYYLIDIYNFYSDVSNLPYKKLHEIVEMIEHIYRTDLEDFYVFCKLQRHVKPPNIAVSAIFHLYFTNIQNKDLARKLLTHVNFDYIDDPAILSLFKVALYYNDPYFIKLILYRLNKILLTPILTYILLMYSVNSDLATIKFLYENFRVIFKYTTLIRRIEEVFYSSRNIILNELLETTNIKEIPMDKILDYYIRVIASNSKEVVCYMVENSILLSLKHLLKMSFDKTRSFILGLEFTDIDDWTKFDLEDRRQIFSTSIIPDWRAEGLHLDLLENYNYDKYLLLRNELNITVHIQIDNLEHYLFPCLKNEDERMTDFYIEFAFECVKKYSIRDVLNKISSAIKYIYYKLNSSTTTNRLSKILDTLSHPLTFREHEDVIMYIQKHSSSLCYMEKCQVDFYKKYLDDDTFYSMIRGILYTVIENNNSTPIESIKIVKEHLPIEEIIKIVMRSRAIKLDAFLILYWTKTITFTDLITLMFDKLIFSKPTIYNLTKNGKEDVLEIINYVTKADEICRVLPDYYSGGRRCKNIKSYYYNYTKFNQLHCVIHYIINKTTIVVKNKSQVVICILENVYYKTNKNDALNSLMLDNEVNIDSFIVYLRKSIESNYINVKFCIKQMSNVDTSHKQTVRELVNLIENIHIKTVLLKILNSL